LSFYAGITALIAQEDSLYIMLNTQASKAALYGKHQEAIALYKAVLKKARTNQLPVQNFQYRTALHKLGGYASLSSDYEKVILYYEELLALEAQLERQKTMPLGDLLQQLGYAYAQQKKYAKAQQYYQQRLDLMDKDAPQYINALYSTALMSAKQPEAYHTAERLFKKMIQLQKKQTPNDVVLIAKRKQSLGVLYRKQKRYKESEKIYQEILSELTEPTHLVLIEKARVWSALAWLYDDQGAYKKAEEWYWKALSLEEQQHGKDSPKLASTLERLGKFYKREGSLQKSIDLYWRILFLYTNNCFRKSAVRQRATAQLIALYQRLGDSDGVEAVQQFVEHCAD